MEYWNTKIKREKKASRFTYHINNYNYFDYLNFETESFLIYETENIWSLKHKGLLKLWNFDDRVCTVRNNLTYL